MTTIERYDPLDHGWKELPVRAFFRSIGPLYAKRSSVGEWEYGLLTTDQHDNSTGAVHGGVLASFMDQALSTIAWNAAGRSPASTVSLDLQFASAVRPGSFIIAQGRVVRVGKSLVFLTGLIVCDGSDVVSGSGVWSVSRKSMTGAA